MSLEDHVERVHARKCEIAAEMDRQVETIEAAEGVIAALWSEWETLSEELSERIHRPVPMPSERSRQIRSVARFNRNMSA